MIAKRATDPSRFARTFVRTDSARAAFSSCLSAAGLGSGDTVLLPSYVGWSPREGSGVFDPVRLAGLTPVFYRLDRSLNVDVESVEASCARRPVRLVLLIHYFGRPDPQAGCVVEVARRHGALVVEDEAHALFTDLVSGASGRLGDLSLFSLHKMVPVSSGGMLAANGRGLAILQRVAPAAPYEGAPWCFDLASIAHARRANSQLLAELVAKLAPAACPLWRSVDPAVVLQTYPIIIHRGCRDDIYQAMNATGFGVVSLYHTLIGEIARPEFPDSHWVSRRILNLPVHQDASHEELTAMVEHLAGLLR